MSRPSKFSPEMQERAVRMVWRAAASMTPQWAAIRSIAGEAWLYHGDTAALGSAGRSRPGQARRVTTIGWPSESVQLERENRELRRANEILKLASAFFAQAELDRRTKS